MFSTSSAGDRKVSRYRRDHRSGSKSTPALAVRRASGALPHGILTPYSRLPHGRGRPAGRPFRGASHVLCGGSGGKAADEQERRGSEGELSALPTGMDLHRLPAPTAPDLAGRRRRRGAGGCGAADRGRLSRRRLGLRPGRLLGAGRAHLAQPGPRLLGLRGRPNSSRLVPTRCCRRVLPARVAGRREVWSAVASATPNPGLGTFRARCAAGPRPGVLRRPGRHFRRADLSAGAVCARAGRCRHRVPARLNPDAPRSARSARRTVSHTVVSGTTSCPSPAIASGPRLPDHRRGR